MKQITQLLLFCSIIISSCQNKALENIDNWEDIKNSLKVEDYINYIFLHPNTKNFDKATSNMDSLISLNNDISLTSNLIINTIEKSVCYKFSNTIDDHGDYYIKEMNSFKITITNDNVIHNNRYISLDSIKHIVKCIEFKRKCNAFEPQVELKNIKYFGNSEVSKLSIIIDTDTMKINWNLYFNTIQYINEVFEEIWNETSIRKWEKKYSELDFDKQVAILELIPLALEINFRLREFNENQ